MFSFNEGVYNTRDVAARGTGEQGAAGGAEMWERSCEPCEQSLGMHRGRGWGGNALE